MRPPGLLEGSTRSLDAASAIDRMRLEEGAGRDRVRALIALNDHGLEVAKSEGANASPILGSPDVWTQPIQVAEAGESDGAQGAVVSPGHLEGRGSVALAMRQLDGWTSVDTLNPVLSASFLRALARSAGGSIHTDTTAPSATMRHPRLPSPFRLPPLLGLASPSVLAALTALAALAALAAPGPSSSPLSAEERPWFERLIVGMEVGPTGAQLGGAEHDADFARRLSGRDIVRASVAAHSQYLVIWARDGEFAYYDSKLLPKPAGLGERDALREALDEARGHNLPIIAYCQLQYPGHELREHPDWRMQDREGKPIEGRVCYNSPYVEHVKELLAEMLAYEIAGFHLDMVDQGFGPPYGCWCPRCRKLFETEHGKPMPAAISWDEDWLGVLEQRYASSARFERALRAHVRKLSPRASVDFNYHGNPPFSWEVGQRPVEHAGNGDFVTGETGQWGFSALGVSLNAEFYRASTPGLPYQVAMQRGVRMYHDQTTRPLADIRWELFTLLAHGAFVTMVDKTAYDGGLDPVAYSRIGAAFEEALAKREELGQEPVYDIGLYFSARTRDGYGREDAPRYFQSFQGAHRACVSEHLTFGVALDENATLESLRRFPVLCLPNAAILSAEEVALLGAYVESGGNLLVTGQSGQYDKLGRPLKSSVLRELIGAEAESQLESLDNWVRLSPTSKGALAPSRSGANDATGDPDGSTARPDSAASATKDSTGGSTGGSTADAARLLETLARDIPLDWPFLVKGPATVYRPTAASVVPLGQLLRPHRTLLQRKGRQSTDWPMSADAPVGPAALHHRVGSGAVLAFAGSPDFTTASEHAITEARWLFRNAVRLLRPDPRVEVTAPANVEAVVTDDPKARTLRIHFIAYNSLPQTTPARGRPFVLPGLMEEAPIFKAVIRLKDPVRGARALGASTELRREGSVVRATIQNVHEVIRVEY